jgi:hypothetical protein
MDDKPIFFRHLSAVDGGLNARLKHLDPLVVALEKAAMATARVAKKTRQLRKPRKGGATLRPGTHTPLWNELATACSRHLSKRGDKVRLARILGIPRQRLHQLLVAKTACADAERTLQLPPGSKPVTAAKRPPEVAT